MKTENLIVKYVFFLTLFVLLVLIILHWETYYSSRGNTLSTLKVEEYKKFLLKKYPNLPITSEISERMSIHDHLKEDDVVLEIGGNIGGVSSLIAIMLKNPRNLVVVDPLKANCHYLSKLGKSLNAEFNVFHGVVIGNEKNKLNCIGPDKVGSYVNCFPSNNPETINYRIKDLEHLFNINFSAIVIDCEGCYTSFFKDILDSSTIKKIFIEWDGAFIEKDILNSGFKHIGQYSHVELDKGVSVYEKI
jgi:hypothetical protein